MIGGFLGYGNHGGNFFNFFWFSCLPLWDADSGRAELLEGFGEISFEFIGGACRVHLLCSVRYVLRVGMELQSDEDPPNSAVEPNAAVHSKL